MIVHYVETRSDEPELFDPRNYLRFGDMTDPDVNKAFKEKHASFKPKLDAAAVLRSIAATNSWSPEDISCLSELPVDDYYKMLKGSKGKTLRTLINACLQFERFGDATPEMREVSKRAKDALIRIAKESPINASRVKPYGIEIDSKPAAASETS